MRYFDRAELVSRYHSSRPRVQPLVIEELFESRQARPIRSALDVACGTGHSTAALAPVAASVCGCDVSLEMLSAALLEASTARFARSTAESLAYSPRSFDLVTVSMAFHWFDQREFLKETARVLVPGGELWIYNLFFPGVLIGDEKFFAWHRDRYLARYPVPARHSTTLSKLLQSEKLPLALAEKRRFEYEIPFSAEGLRNYLTTQSNIEAALRGGATLQEVDAWLDRELAPFFREKPDRKFSYLGYAEIAVVA